MKILSRLKIVTVTDVREEYETDCTVEFVGDGAELKYSTDDGAYTVIMCEGSAVVTRTGSSGYVLNLVKGERTEFTGSVGELRLYTKELLFKSDAETVRFAARYEFDGGHEIQIIIKTFKRG